MRLCCMLLDRRINTLLNNGHVVGGWLSCVANTVHTASTALGYCVLQQQQQLRVWVGLMEHQIIQADGWIDSVAL